MEVSGVDFLNSFSSVLQLIDCGFLIERVVFDGVVQFVLEKFDSESEGLGGNDISPDFFQIYESEFKKGVSFRIEESSGVETLEIRGCLFKGDLEFLAHKNLTSFKKLIFRNLTLEGNVIMEYYEFEIEEDLINGGSRVGELNFDRCFFLGVLNLRLINIQSLNFSESQIDYKKIFCSEYSLLEPTIISKDDEPKFRFLKKYFADQGNHSKEQEYFSYEMTAREKKLSIEGGTDLFLFKCYKWFSGFGMSVVLPFAWLSLSFAAFFDVFLWLGCDLESSLTNSFVRTINPLMKFDIVGCVDSNPILALQSLINVTLIFLLGLGIRNKFKIK